MSKEINIKFGTWDIYIKKKTLFSTEHKYFAFYNSHLEKDKTFENNTLEQGRSVNVFGIYISIIRKRDFSQVKDIHKFINNEARRIGCWSWRN